MATTGRRAAEKAVSGTFTAASDYLYASIGGLFRRIGIATLFTQPTVDASFKTLSFKATHETNVAPAITSNVLTIDLTAGTVFETTVNANITTFTISGAPSGTASFLLKLTANGTGYTQAWGDVMWANGGIAPVLSTTNGAIDVLSFVKIGSDWYGFNAGQNFS